MLAKILPHLFAFMRAIVCTNEDQSSVYVEWDTACANDHSVACSVGTFPDDAQGAVCCDDMSWCRIDGDGTCKKFEQPVCGLPALEWLGQICMNNMVTYLEHGQDCEPGTQHVCNVGAFGVPDPYAIACCADDLDCIPTTYPGECPDGYVAMCEMN